MKVFCAAIALSAVMLGCAAQSSTSLSTTNPAHPDAPQAPLVLAPAETLFISGDLPAPATTNHSANHTRGAKPYPLDVCLVGDDDLHSMGKPIAFVHEGREIKVCCPECKETFLKEPATYLKKLDDIIKTKKPAPATKPVAPKEHEHDHH